MAEPNFIPQTFQAQSNAIASYNYTDIAEGTGVSVFYLCSVSTSSGLDYVLTQNTMPGVATTGTASTSYIDFDLTPFNAARTIKGVAYVAGEGVCGAGAQDFQVIAKIVHYDGTTETVIGAETNSETIRSGELYNIPFSLTEKRFKRGDILRVKLKIDTSTNSPGISTDPLEVAPAGIICSRVYIPFRLDEVGS